MAWTPAPSSASVAEGVVDDEVPAGEQHCSVVAHRVSRGSELHAEDAFEAVTPAGGGGETDEAAVGCRTDAALEGHRRQVVAFVDDDQPVAVEILGVVAASQSLEGDEVDDPAAAGSSGAELADLAPLQAEQVAEALAPLLGEGEGSN